jgi:hypothetical protein
MALAGSMYVGPALPREVHLSPEERLDAIDVQLIATAKQSIDFASYALTDSVVIEAPAIKALEPK